jgi:hypothetical protein
LALILQEVTNYSRLCCAAYDAQIIRALITKPKMKGVVAVDDVVVDDAAGSGGGYGWW